MRKMIQGLLVAIILFVGMNIVHATNKQSNKFKATYCGYEPECRLAYTRNRKMANQK